MVHTEETGSGLSERTSRYRVRQISSRTPGNHGGVLSLTRPITGRTVVDAADIVPSLTTLALDAIVANFESASSCVNSQMNCKKILIHSLALVYVHVF